jgi:hypothetical protein
MLLLLEIFFLKFQGSHSEVLEQLILKQRNDMHKVCKVQVEHAHPFLDASHNCYRFLTDKVMLIISCSLN